MTLEEALARIAELELQLAEANGLLKDALRRLEELEREKNRQAGPFRRREELKVKPEEKKKLGRAPGHSGAYRRQPPQVDETIVIKLENCPHCRAPVDQGQLLMQYIEEIPPIKPVTTRLITWSGKCPNCGEVHSTHPLQTSRAQGAAGVQLGPRAQALSVVLNKSYGIPLRGVCKILKQGFGLSLTSGGLAQLIQRTARKVAGKYDQLIEQIRGSDAVYADETSWYVGGPGHWLWVFTTPQSTVYRIAPSRGHPVAAKLLGRDFAGVLVSDSASVYRAFRCPQHKCIAHHLQAIKRERQRPKMKDPSYLDAWESLWKGVIQLTRERDGLPPEHFAARREQFQSIAAELKDRDVTQTGDEKFRTRMRNAGEHLFGCLNHQVDPTNNRAERAIRPAVVARKISCGNKTERGASATQILMSLAATAHQQARDFLTDLAQSLALPTAQAG